MSATMMPPDEARRAAAPLYSPRCLEDEFREVPPSGLPLCLSNRMGQGYNQVGDLD